MPDPTGLFVGWARWLERWSSCRAAADSTSPLLLAGREASFRAQRTADTEEEASQRKAGTGSSSNRLRRNEAKDQFCDGMNTMLFTQNYGLLTILFANV